MSWLFRPRGKAQKDRATLKLIDHGLSRQGLPSALLHLLLFFILESYLFDQSGVERLIYLFGLALVIMASWRFIMIAQFESWYAKGPARWRNLFILSGFVHAAIWSAYLAYRLSSEPGSPILLVGLFYTATIAAGGTFVYAPYGRTVRLYLAVLLAPLAAHYLLAGTGLIERLLALGVIAMYFYLTATAQKLSGLIWNFLAANCELKQQLAKLEQARAATRVENSSNRRFVNQVLLRIKNPLAGLVGVLGMLTGGGDSEQQSMLGIARRSGYSILDLISDLEAFVEQRDRSRVPQSMVFNLRKTLEHALVDMGAKAHEHGHELAYLYDPNVPERIQADPQWLSNAFRRLIDFTLEMAAEGEITVRISFVESQQEPALQLIFYFVNHEITAADLSAVLQRQMDVFPDDEDLADQLTLMVAAAQFKALGARLSADAKGRLKKIFVTLPIQVSSQQASSLRPEKYMAGRAILLVDLSPHSGRALAAEFSNWQMAVERCALPQVSARLEAARFDFIFINLPVDDQGAAAQLGSIQMLYQQWQTLPVRWLLYASELQRSLLAEAEDHYIFVEKPVTRDALLAVLKVAGEHSLRQLTEAYRCTQSKILLAENNLLNQRVVLRMLAPMGVTVETCGGGEEAIAAVTKQDYKLILMDCAMPRIDGLAATRAIRQAELSSGRHIPIVGMTSQQTPEMERACLVAGMDDFLSKPLQRDALLEMLQRWTA